MKKIFTSALIVFAISMMIIRWVFDMIFWVFNKIIKVLVPGFSKPKQTAPKKKLPNNPIKAVGAGNPWQKRNAKYDRQDEKRHERQMRTGNK